MKRYKAPNPSGVDSVTANMPSNPGNPEVFDMYGKRIYLKQISVAPGIYMVKFTGGEKSFIDPIIIE